MWLLLTLRHSRSANAFIQFPENMFKIKYNIEMLRSLQMMGNYRLVRKTRLNLFLTWNALVNNASQ